MTDVSRAISSCIIALFCCLLPVFSITGEHPVLIISSYNPDAAVLPATSQTLWRSSNAWAGQTPSHWKT